MRIARTLLAFLLMMTMSLSSWASTTTPCSSTRTSEITQDDNSNHSHHGSAAHSTSENSVSELQKPLQPETEASYFPLEIAGVKTCCDDCVGLCTASGCMWPCLNPAYAEIRFSSSGGDVESATVTRTSPIPQSLFRPPATDAS